MPSATSRPLWGWTAPVRGLLIVSTMVSAIGLLVAAPRGEDAPAPLPPLIVDPNTAPAPVLMALPRLGPSLVGRIVVARAQAPFRSIDDLEARVRGLGPATIKALQPHLRIDPTNLQAADRSLATAPSMAHNAR
ncbi:competence protein ComEA [Singulisphaera sp. GP187]|uniref:ComEA family DNA-binding protein n=1 Tax=Singulisphaera sp. GP187 TaxID=1882752 RepID=UPI0009278818|nr:helix-hairpin-helix domain-containing protein [Singulisphaera sp. GP187]SIO19743.1 competence protein ComEA [Singulisphaera sp. GP187]